MDTLYWKTLNSDIEFKTTRKQYFGQYLWRLEMSAHCADVTRYDDMVAEVARLKKQAIIRNTTSSAWNNRWCDPHYYDQIDYSLLRSIKTIKSEFADLVKIRIEDSAVQFYARTESAMKQVAGALSHRGSLKSITGPEIGTESLLYADVIISKRIQHRYKVMLRDGKYNLQTKQQMLHLLQDQGDNVKITAGVVHAFTRPYPGMWGAFFYCNDLAVTTMLALMSPGIVGKIHEVVPG